MLVTVRVVTRGEVEVVIVRVETRGEVVGVIVRVEVDIRRVVVVGGTRMVVVLHVIRHVNLQDNGNNSPCPNSRPTSCRITRDGVDRNRGCPGA